MAFKMKHGAAPKFKDLGSSPIQQNHDTTYFTQAIDTAQPGGESAGWSQGTPPQMYQNGVNITKQNLDNSPSPDIHWSGAQKGSLDAKIMDLLVPGVAAYKGYKFLRGLNLFNKGKKSSKVKNVEKVINKSSDIVKKAAEKTRNLATKPLYKGDNKLFRFFSRPVVAGPTIYGADQLAQMLTSDKTSLTEKQIYDATQDKKVINSLRVIRGKKLHGDDYDFNEAIKTRNQYQIDAGYTPGELTKDQHIELRKNNKDYNAVQTTINNTIIDVNKTIDTLNKGYNIK
tara:strand:+ start:1561 stop:2415 length:855 start_codon:yes stop_codon:yes gene_type:complete